MCQACARRARLYVTAHLVWFFSYPQPLLTLRLLSQDLYLGGLNLSSWKKAVCPSRYVPWLRHYREKLWMDQTPGRGIQNSMHPSHSACLYAVQTHTKPRPAGEQFLLASREAVLWVSLSITHHSGPLDTEAQGTHPTQVSDEHYRVISMNSKGKKLEISFSSHLFWYAVE